MAQSGLLVYADALQKDFQVVVIFGREANNTGETTYAVERYDWRLSPRSIFWNTSYGLAARCAGFPSGAALKSACTAAGGSPIAFANCSPVPIPEGAAKDAIRLTIDPSTVTQNIRGVFALLDSALPGRLAGVVLSVGDDFAFSAISRKAIAEEAGQRGVPVFELPYMRQGLSSSTLDAALGPAGRALLRRVFAPVEASQTARSAGTAAPALTPKTSASVPARADRQYERLVGVERYCDWIDADLHRSPFMDISGAGSPIELGRLDDAGVATLAGDGFFLVDGQGRIVDDNSSAIARFVIAPHVAQRETGGRFPKHFDRIRGAQCGFGGRAAKKIPRAQASGVLSKAWAVWGSR